MPMSAIWRRRVVRAHVGLERVVRPVDRPDEGADALEDRVVRRLLQHLLAVERRHRELAGDGVDPAGRHGAVGVRRRTSRSTAADATTRARASPVSAPTVALISPGLFDRIAATVNDAVGRPCPSAPASDHVGAGSSRRKRPLRVEQPRVQLHGLPGLQHQLGRARPARTPARRRPSPPARRPRSRSAPSPSSGRSRRRRSLDTKKMRPREIAAPPSIGSGMPVRLPSAVVRADRQLDVAQHLRLVGERPDDEELAALGADVELAVGQHERRLLHRAERLPPQLACRSRGRTPSASSRSRSDRRACRR